MAQDSSQSQPGGGGAAAGNGGGGQQQLRIDTSRNSNGGEKAGGATSGGGGGGVGGQQNGGGADSWVAVQGNPKSGQDSLSLLQLKRLVGEGGRMVMPEYAFRYTPTEDLTAEINEWFSYSEHELLLLVTGPKQTFEGIYTKLSHPQHQPLPPGKVAKWTTSKDVKRRRFIARCTDLLEHAEQEERVRGLEGISFVAQGVFGELKHESEHLPWIKKNVKFLREAGVLEGVYNCLRKAVDKEWNFAQQTTAAAANGTSAQLEEQLLDQRAWNRRELKHALTILYFMVEVTRQVSEEEMQEGRVGHDLELEAFQHEISLLPGEGGLLGFLIQTISRVRWEDNADMPLMHLLLLAWKTSLVQFGNPMLYLPKVKEFARVSAGLSPEVDKDTITASPLDYHLFRQDLIAKYPAYNPPKSLFPFDGPSFLPSMTERDAVVRPGGNADVLLGGRGSIENLTSILDKAVHIATPAPSPPPSPGGVGGKGGKKHNYQTNQSFPFLYPPTDSDSPLNSRFSSEPWWRDDANGVPASIKEAGDLFSNRMRITLAMKQLWNEREAFDKFRRGWTVGDEDFCARDRWRGEDREPRWEENRLAAVEEVYEAALPQLQSLVIVTFKVLLQGISGQQPAPPPAPPVPQNTFADEDARGTDNQPEMTEAFTQRTTSDASANAKQTVADPGVPDEPSPSLRSSWNIFGSKGKANGAAALATISEGLSENEHDWEQERAREAAERDADERRRWDEIDGVRAREISSKAATGLLLNLLKWFRVSHVLKFEYLTQLLMDSNYIPLVLKILQASDVPTSLTTQHDHPARSYFRIAHLHTAHPHPHPPPSPPPPAPAAATSPTSPAPITDYSWRAFFTLTTVLRILQKVVKGKSHRNLALVHYKSSMLFRKPLKAPQHELRLYTLKIFKGQVPYCGRKWRQSNMRVITSIYLHCRPELRDDWLAGGDVEDEVEEAMPQEQALRALTQFYNVRRWPRRMGVAEGVIEEEMDFFAREVERLGGFEEGEEEEWEGEWQ